MAKKILSRGPKHLIVKRGEYGVLMFSDQHIFGAPAFPWMTFEIRPARVIRSPVDF